ncbi:TolC family protein [Sandarakinorhabdus sp. DWP1-3-1]|uniref:TolC family protein n=1 Tax=Sandarakinorhabdus sp. DWP1-3-1 TaxID=2804627 RepID=UPI003CF815CB
MADARRGWRTALVPAVLALAATPAPAQTIILPPPSGAPQAIDFSRDPLLVFGHASSLPGPFLEQLGDAVARHPAVAAAIAEQEAQSGVRTQVRARLFPRIDAQFVAARALARDFGDRSTIVESLSPRARTDVVVAGDQLLFDFGATGARIAAANTRIRAAHADIERAAAETALRAVGAWYDRLQDQMLVDITAAAARRQQAVLADVRARMTQGVGSAGDVARTEAVVADTEALAARLAGRLAQSRARYREAFGVEPPPRLARAMAPASVATRADIAEAMGRDTPAVQVARLVAEAVRRDHAAARADGLPRLSAALNGSRYNIFSGNDYEIRGTLVVRQSLFAGGAQRGRIAEVAADARKAGFEADRVAAEAARDAAIAFAEVEALQATAAVLEAAYVANRRARDSYVEQYRVARGTLIELLRAEQAYATAAVNYVEGVVALDVARYTLLVRTGEMLPAAGVTIGG